MATNQIPALSPRLDLYGNKFWDQLGFLQINNRKVMIRQSLIRHSAILLLLFKKMEARDNYQSPPKMLQNARRTFDSEQIMQQGSSFLEDTTNVQDRYQTALKDDGDNQLRLISLKQVDEDNQLEKEEEKDKISELDGSINLEIDRERINRFMSLANRIRAAGASNKRQRSKSKSSQGSSQKASLQTDGVQVIDDFESDEDDSRTKVDPKRRLQQMTPYDSRVEPIQSGLRSQEEQGTQYNEKNVIDMLSEVEQDSKMHFKLNNAQRITQRPHIIEDSNSDQQSQNSVAFNAMQARHSAELINQDINADERRAMNNRRHLESPIGQTITKIQLASQYSSNEQSNDQSKVNKPKINQQDIQNRLPSIMASPQRMSSRGHNTERKMKESPNKAEELIKLSSKQNSQQKA